MMNIKQVLEKALIKIKPCEEEVKSASLVVNSFLRQLKKNIKAKDISAKVVLGGSFAKGVWISEDFDVDIFVKFSQKYKKDNLSDLLESIISSLDFERVHGSRDYFWIYKDNIKFELVPVLDISKSEQAENVTDFSALHVDWVNKLSKDLKDDIRLLKQFCKANDVYGAESFIKGFSGHVVDILVIYFKGILNLFKAVSLWKTNKKIVVDYYGKHGRNALFFLNKSKTEGPLIVIDPLQPDRNAAAALSLEKLKLFINAVKLFVKKPSEDFFKIKKADINSVKKKGFIVIKVDPSKARIDIMGCRLLQVFDFIKRNFVFEGFVIKKAEWFWDKVNPAFFCFKLENNILSEIAEHKGPPLSLKSAVKLFKDKHKKTFRKDDYLWAKIKRKYCSSDSLLDDLFVSDYVKERVVKIGFF